MNPDKLEINQLLEVEFNNNDKSEYLPSRIEGIRDNQLYIAMPMSKGTLIRMYTGQEINVVLRYKNSVFCFATKVVGSRGGHIPYIIVNKPRIIEPFNQKREYVRLDVELPVKFGPIEDAVELVEEGITIDISAGGALFSTGAKATEGQRIKIEIEISPGNIVKCKALIIRIFEKRANEKDTRVAVKYEDINEAQRDRIFKFIFEKQREWIKKGVVSK